MLRIKMLQIFSSGNLNPREGPRWMSWRHPAMQSRQSLFLEEDKEVFGMKEQQPWDLQLQIRFFLNTDLVHPTAGFLY